MTNTMMDLYALVEKAPDADLLREMIGFAAEKLMELEVGAATGAAWGTAHAAGLRCSYQTFCHSLTNPFYAGVHPDTGKPGLWKPLISRETFEAIQRGSRAAETPPPQPRGYARKREEYPLKALMRCVGCWRPLTGMAVKGGRLALVRFLTDPAAYRSEVRTAWRETAERATVLRARLLREETELVQAQKVAGAAYVKAPEEGAVRPLIASEIESRDVRMREVRRQLGDLAGEVDREAREAEETLDLIEAVLRAPDRLWAEGGLDDRIAVAEAVFPEGLVTDGRKVHTPVTSPLFGLIPQDLAIRNELLATESGMASPTGTADNWNVPLDAVTPSRAA